MIFTRHVLIEDAVDIMGIVLPRARIRQELRLALPATCWKSG